MKFKKKEINIIINLLKEKIKNLEDDDIIDIGDDDLKLKVPEKWCVADTEDVKEFFDKYGTSVYSYKGNGFLHYPKYIMKAGERGICYSRFIFTGYTLISLDEFKQIIKNEIR